MAQTGNAAFARRYYDEVWNKGNLDVADEIFAIEYVRHDPRYPKSPTASPEWQKETAKRFRDAFPDNQL